MVEYLEAHQVIVGDNSENRLCTTKEIMDNGRSIKIILVKTRSLLELNKTFSNHSMS